MFENEKGIEKDIFSKVLRAGRRTYFFDVRETRAGDYYMTITESKKYMNEDGSFGYKKHKIYLYKEDFKDFKDLFNEASTFIYSEKGQEVISERHRADWKEVQPEESTNTTVTTDGTAGLTNIFFEDI